MVSLVLLLFLSSQYLVVINSMQNSGLYRNVLEGFSFGDFEQNPFTYFWVNKLDLSTAEDWIDCTFLCLKHPKCYSFNTAVSPDSKGLYLCELLATDKYSSTPNLRGNVTFHHYSPKGRISRSWIFKHVQAMLYMV